jgi:hypothetical protein
MIDQGKGFPFQERRAESKRENQRVCGLPFIPKMVLDWGTCSGPVPLPGKSIGFMRKLRF